jgi:hypothetical protein
MTDITVFVLILVFLLALFLEIFFFSKRRKKFHDTEEVDGQHESEEYEDMAKQHLEEGKPDEDEIKDIYEDKKKKGQYQPKSYRGTDIEVSASESKKDAKILKHDDLPTIDAQDLVEPEIEESQSSVAEDEEVVGTGSQKKKIKKSGIASDEKAMETMLQEVSENYRMSGESSGLNNLVSAADAKKISKEGGRGR